MEENELIVLVGLPRSGKSTWARKQGMPIVNPDSIRLALHGQRFQVLAEPMVWAICYVMIRSLFLAGHGKVIVDATHTTEKRRTPYIEQFSDICRVTFKVFDTSEAVCIKRAEDIGDQVIIPIIQKMAKQWEPCRDK